LTPQTTTTFLWTVSFRCPLDTQYPTIVPQDTGLVAAVASSPVVISSRRSVLPSTVLSGSFQIAFAVATGSPVWSPPVPFSATASVMASAINAAGAAFGADVTVSASGTTMWGQVFIVSFNAPTGDVPPLLVDPAGLSGDGANVTVVVLEQGSTDLFLDPIPADFFQASVTLYPTPPWCCVARR
jgi:hypothetical protein